MTVWTEQNGWDLPAALNMAHEVCDRWAETEPERLAIIDAPTGQQVTFGQLRKMSAALAHGLHARGVRPGDRVGVLRTQHPWTAAGHIAVWKLGAISIPLFVLFGEDGLKVRLQDADVACVITDAEGAGRVQALGFDAVVPEADLSPEAVSHTAPFATVDTGPEDPAVLIYTSGTTGAPKGALHGHRVLRGHLPGVEISHDHLPQPGDVLWTPADWAWIGGLFDVLMPGLWHGVPVVAARFDKFTPEACAALIAAHKVRNVFFPPTALRMLKAADMHVPGLRSVASGGEPLGPEMLAWGRKAFGLSINEFYGQTECNMIVSSCHSAFSVEPGAMGRPVPGHEVTVLNADAAGEGDIAVRRGSASMMLRYWNRPEATAKKFAGDWLLTGDRGIKEPSGAIRFQGREDDVITSAGYRIGPAEIEDCLITHPDVVSAGVIGQPDAVRTQIVVACVVLRAGATGSDALADALASLVKTRLGAHEYPRKVVFLPELPMTVTGKIRRGALRAMLQEEVL